MSQQNALHMLLSHVNMYGLLTKLVRSRWLDIGQVLFLCVYGPRRIIRAGQSPYPEVANHSARFGSSCLLTELVI